MVYIKILVKYNIYCKDWNFMIINKINGGVVRKLWNLFIFVS